MAGTAEILKIAVLYYQAGQLQQAENLCRLILQKESCHTVTLHLLALVAYQTDRSELALELIDRAIAKNPQVALFHNTRGVIFKSIERLEDAVDACQQALSLKPDYADAYNNLGIVLKAQGKYVEAIQKYEQAIHCNPQLVGAYYNLANIMEQQGQHEKAVENFKKAIQLKPDHADACNNLGVALKTQGKYVEAAQSYKQAIHFKPELVDAHYNLADILREQGQYEQAIEHYKKAIQLKPDYADAHWNQSLTLLLNGEFEQGWKEYQWRRHVNSKVPIYPHVHQKPRWQGAPFPGKRLFIHCEQGFGDTLQFLRYLPMVKARGGTVILEAWKALHGLLRQLDCIDELLELSWDTKSGAEFDFFASIMDLPGIFKTTLQNIPADIPYIFADTDKVSQWQKQIPSDGFKVGIAWAGRPLYKEDHNRRSCAVRKFAPLTEIDGVRLYSLQKGPASAHLDDLPEVTDLAGQFEDFTDTAAVIENLDMVISIDTAVVHLAGAMARPVWTLLPYSADWRWLLNRQDSPWYPTMRLFRQQKPGDWDDVFNRVAEQLQILVKKQMVEC